MRSKRYLNSSLTREDVTKAIDEAKSLLRSIDRIIGVKSIKGEYE